MGKTRVEICLISARGLQGSSLSLFWNTQWFAVGWIDPNDKYCTKIDAPGNGKPVWKTKFSSMVDDSSPGVTLHVEVYSRDPVFLRKKHQGTATVVLREFLARRKGDEETGSYQLRKGKSDRPRGFVDVSIRVLGEGQELDPFSFSGDGMLVLSNHENGIAMGTDNASSSDQPVYPTGPSPLPLAAHRVQNPSRAEPYTQPRPFPTNFSNHSVGGPTYPRATGPSFLNLPQLPVPRPLPLLPYRGRFNFDYRPNYGPITEYPGRTYINMPSSTAAAGGGRGIAGLGMAAGAGALGAGAFIFGEEYMSGFDFPGGRSDPSFTVSLDPPF